MPNNAGAVDATPTRRIVHLSYVDSDGKPRTDSYDIPIATTDAALNALTAAAGGVTNASLWAIGVTNWFTTGVALKTDAVDEPNDSVMDNVVLLMKNAAGLSFDFFIPANDEGVTMVDGTEDVNLTSTDIGDLITALVGIWSGYEAYSARFSERSKKNRSQRF